MAAFRGKRVALMGWGIFIIVGALLLLVGWRMKFPKGGLLMFATALCLAGAGYAAQGHPSLVASPGEKQDRNIGELADTLFRIRDQMDRNFGPHRAPLTLADSVLRNGNRDMALAAIEGALKQHPENGELLNARALALYISTQGEVSPAVKLAFEQARQKSSHPGPDYFEGLAALLSGNPADTERLWESALARKWNDDGWRTTVTAQLSSLKEMRGQAERLDESGRLEAGTR